MPPGAALEVHAGGRADWVARAFTATGRTWDRGPRAMWSGAGGAAGPHRMAAGTSVWTLEGWGPVLSVILLVTCSALFVMYAVFLSLYKKNQK